MKIVERLIFRLLAATLPLIFLLPAGAQPVLPNKFYFTHMGVENGLDQNTVWCILQDHTGFMWFGTKDGLARYDGYKFRNFRYDADDPSSLGNNFVHSLYEDRNGRIWVGTNAGVYIYDPGKENFSRFDVKTEDGRTITREVNCIVSDPDGNLWFGVSREGLFCYKPGSPSLVLYEPVDGDDTSLGSANVRTLCVDAEGNLWIGCDGGRLDLYDKATGSFIHNNLGNTSEISKIVRDAHNQLLVGTSRDGLYSFNPWLKTAKPMFDRPEYRKLYVRDIFTRNSNEIMMGTDNGVYIYNYTSKKMQNVSQDFGNPYSLSCKSVCSIYRDKEGAMWFGTYFGGVNYLPPPSVMFEKFYPSKSRNQLSGMAVREFVEDEEGIIWIGTEDEGLNRFDPSTEQFTRYTTSNSALSYDDIHALCVDETDLYIGTSSAGLDIMNLKTGRITNYRQTGSPGSLPDDSVNSLFRDRENNIWVGMSSGLCIYDRASGTFGKVAMADDDAPIFDIRQGTDGNIYFSSYGKGILCYNPYLDKWNMLGGEQEAVLRNVISIDEDSSSKIWFGTEGRGVVCYDPATGEMRSVTTRDGLPNDVVYKVVEDRNKNLWVSTNKGLACYDPATGSIRVYTSNNGLTSDQFNYKAGMRDGNGKLYFGTINGFVSFVPEHFTVSNNLSPVILTGLKITGRPVEPGTKGSVLETSMPYTESIRLRHNQSTFTIDFALLSYNASNRNLYRYIMRNYTDEWTQPSPGQSVSFLNVPPGKYVFEVQGANSDGVWNDESTKLEIEISSPFYASTVAYIIYVILAGSLVWLYVGWLVRKTRQKNNRRIAEIEQKREREEYEAKIEFFTNITHEIRTPLSLIRGPYEQITKQGIKPSDYEENIEIMGVNIDRLLQLSNQLLDIRKAENERFVLNNSDIDLGVLIEECILQFKQKINQKNIRLAVSLPERQTVICADRDVLTKIISNLLDNAVKYSNSNIGLNVEIDEDMNEVTISVSNDGDPIPPQYHEKIFETFFQIRGNSRGGTGLGLPLVKRLVEQQNGTISVTADGDSTVFVVKLPYKRENAESSESRTEMVEKVGDAEEAERYGDAVAPNHILVVEDDSGMQDFLRSLLSQTYSVSVAGDADAAFEMLNTSEVDLIVTDIMMPGMNGFELCKFLKSRIDYSHIPVVILSAKSDTESKILGLDAGADAYVEKPFSGDYLIAQISTIITNRHIRRRSFSDQPFSSTGSLTPNKADRAFLDRVTEIVNENISEPDFNVDDLAGLMAMSRSNLHRKIKGLLQMPPNDFMRLLKLRKAAELLSEGEYRISEISYMTGFNSSSYFAKCFQKQFGVLPKEFTRQGNRPDR